MKPGLLIIDDDEDIRSQMKWALMGEYEVHMAEDRRSGLLKSQQVIPAIILLDLGLPPDPGNNQEGFETLNQILEWDKTAKIIIITGQGEKENALRAIGEGAYDFLSKPVDLEELKVILKRALYLAELEREYAEMRSQLNGDSFEGMLGASPQMQQVFTSIRKVANTDAPVLILGESGTGKEMVALAVHRRSCRREGPFVPINCGAIPENLLESELFGHEKGSFTGAHTQRVGRIETAHGGTLFLDEIGELPLQLQVKLLRFLQEQRIERVGGRKEIVVNTRVIAATNSDLQQAMAEGRFREDLYYRLAVVVINLPPLRERPSDILFIAQAFLQRFAAESRKKGVKFERAALHALEQHRWPGNVRELDNRIRRAVIMSEGAKISPADLELASPSIPKTLKEAREEVELEVIQQALQRHKGKISPAADDLGVSRPTLYDLMEKLGIRQEHHEPLSK